MAKPIVDGIPNKTSELVEVIHLNLLVGAGREAASRYGIRMVPATVLLDNQGQLLDQQPGRPDTSRLLGRMNLLEERSI
jgi:hypothetical protein